MAKIGVWISVKSNSSIFSLKVFSIFERSKILLCNFSFLKSRKRYSNLKSSLTSWLLFISKGNTFLHFPKISTWLATTSISPVGILLFLLLLSTTFPFMWIQLSVFHSFASCCIFSSFITICVIPNSSLKSINIIPPKFLIFWIQPLNSTTSSTLWIFNSPHVFVLYILIPPFAFYFFYITTNLAVFQCF